MTTKEFLEKYPMVQESDLFSVVFEMNRMVEEVYEQMYHSEQDQLEEDQLEEESWMELYESETLEDDDDAYTSFNDSILSQSRFHIIASTSFGFCETYYFPSTDGINHTREELGCSMALRCGHWEFDNEDEILNRLTNHFPGYLIEKKDTINIDSDMGHTVKRVYSLSKLS
jgi:hypothetical protein